MEHLGCATLPHMEQWFSYVMLNGNALLRIGKGHCFGRTETQIISYLRSRYGSEGWTRANIRWHTSESASLKEEKWRIDQYKEVHGRFPPWNLIRGGGGRQIFVKCKLCANDALDGNYGFCGIHR